MAFKGDTFNHFMREAKREYDQRRKSIVDFMVCINTPLWRELTDAQRTEWAQYMHDEWLKRSPVIGPEWNVKPNLNDMFGKFGGQQYDFVVTNEVAPMTAEQFEGLCKSNSLFMQCFGRVTRERAEAKAKSKLMYPRPDGSDEHDYKDPIEPVDISETEAVNRRVDVFEQRVTALEKQMGDTFMKAEPVKESEYKLAVCVREQAEEINKLKADLEFVRGTVIKAEEALTNELNKPKPYAISREQYEKITRKIRGPWYTKAKFFKYDFTQMPVAYMTDEQYVRVSGLARFEKL